MLDFFLCMHFHPEYNKEIVKSSTQATKIQVIEKDAPMPYYHLINLLLTFSSI